MAKNDAWAEGTESVVSWYEEMTDQRKPYYSIWCGTNLRFAYDGDDVADGADLLRKNLDMAKKVGNSTLMVIRLHRSLDVNGNITQKSPYSASLPFRCVSVEEDAFAMYNLNGFGKVDRFTERMAAIEKKLEEPEARPGFLGMMDGILGNPEVQPIIAQAAVNAVVGLVNKFLPGVFPGQPAAQPPRPAPALAGVNEVVKDLDWALDVLEANDPDYIADLVKLAEIAQNNTALFQMLLTNLRSIK